MLVAWLWASSCLFAVMALTFGLLFWSVVEAVVALGLLQRRKVVHSALPLLLVELQLVVQEGEHVHQERVGHIDPV